jgi:UMF1 family MFS transporter
MTETPAAPTPAPVTYVRKVVVSWALYDMANTIYSAIVMTAFLVPLFKEHYGSYTPVGVATSVTLLLSAFASTRFGGNVDRTGRARPGLDLWTNLCVVATAALYFVIDVGAWPTLVVYGASLFAYQAALTYYNALLPVVAPVERRGAVSGLGVGLGYAGIPIALMISKFMLGHGIEAQATFLLAAVLMTVGTIPLWLHV